MKKVILSAVIAFAATSALAQAVVHEEYYVVRDPATKRCTIVDQKPTVTATIVDHGIFKTRSEAETGMKTMIPTVICVGRSDKIGIGCRIGSRVPTI